MILLLHDHNKTILSLGQLDIKEPYTVRGKRLDTGDNRCWIPDKKNKEYVRCAAWGVSAYVSVAGSFYSPTNNQILGRQGL